MSEDSEAAVFLRESFFTNISHSKLKNGILNGPDIRRLMRCEEFDLTLSPKHLAAWKSFKAVVDNFLGNYKAPNYKKLVEQLLINYKEIGANMSLKIHFLHSHLDYFSELPLGEVSDEQGERFHQDIATFEQRYAEKISARMMGDYCWSLIRETNIIEYNRRSQNTKHF